MFVSSVGKDLFFQKKKYSKQLGRFLGSALREQIPTHYFQLTFVVIAKIIFIC